MQINIIDPGNRDEFAQWFDVLNGSVRDSWPGDTPLDARAAHEAAMDLTRPGTARDGHLLLAKEGGKPLGVARLALPIRDNISTAELQLHVLPAVRRQGIGSRVLEEATRLAVAAGRSQVYVEIDESDSGSGMGEAGTAFAMQHGYKRGLVETRRSLPLPVEQDRLVSLHTTRHSPAPYALRVWRDFVPEDLLDERAALERRMSTDVPWGDIEHEEEDYDGARIREEELLVRSQGRTYLGAAAVAEGGQMVGFTDLGLTLADPHTATQWGTFVSGPHRGRRLGITLKLALLDELHRVSPNTKRIVTWNAETNFAMVRVNEALGFRRDGQRSAWSRRVGSPQAWPGS